MTRAWILAPFALLLPHLALAEDAEKKEEGLFGGEAEVKLKLDRITARNGQRDVNDLYPEVETKFYVNIAPFLRIDGTVKAETVREIGNRSRAFQDVGAYLETLTLSVTFEPVRLYAGKFTLPFGSGWDKAPGLYGDSWASDYEYSERLGFGADVTLPIEFGEHVVNVAAFRRDTSAMSSSVLTRPAFDDPRLGRVGRARRWHGGIANTAGLESWLIGLSGSKVPLGHDWSYGIAYASQAAGLAGERREKAWVAYLSTEIPLGEDLKLTPLVEYGHFQNYGGADQRADYLLLGAELGWEAWTAALVGQWRTVRDRASATTTRDHFVSAALGYDLSELVVKDLSVTVGAAQFRENRDTYQQVGIEFSYKISF